MILITHHGEDGIYYVPDFSEEIDKGMALLDKVAPGWESSIDIGTLNVANADECILGQVYFHKHIASRVAKYMEPVDEFTTGYDSLSTALRQAGLIDEAAEIGCDYSPSQFGEWLPTINCTDTHAKMWCDFSCVITAISITTGMHPWEHLTRQWVTALHKRNGGAPPPVPLVEQVYPREFALAGPAAR